MTRSELCRVEVGGAVLHCEAIYVLASVIA